MPPDPPGFFPPAESIPPLSPPHRQSMILLHGRGLSAHTFGPELLATTFPFPPPANPPPHPPTTSTEPATTTLHTLFPHAHTVLPPAPRHRATLYKRSIIRQWFDDAAPAPQSRLQPQQQQPNSKAKSSLPEEEDDSDEEEDDLDDDADEEEWRAIPGLHATVRHIHGLIRAETAKLPGGCTRNIVLGGLSQGCAAALMALLLWPGEEEPLGGFVGVCGWLVFERDVKRVLKAVGGCGGGGGGGGGGEVEKEGRGEDEYDPFEREEGGAEDSGGESQGNISVEARVVRVLREMLELDDVGGALRSRPRVFDTPVFLGHGVEDDKVPVARGRAAAECLRAAGLDVEWREYRSLGHWWSPEMLTDMASFLKKRTDWDTGEKAL